MNLPISSSDSARQWRRCLAVFVGVVVGGGLLIIAFLLAVDPYDSGRFNVFGIQGVDDRSPATANASRARDPQFDSAIIGNSTGQRLNPAELSQATGLRFAQLASPGANPREQLAMLDFFIRHHQHIGAVVIVADRLWCTHDPALPSGKPFPFWLYGESTVGYAGRLFSWNGLDHAFQRIMIGLGRPKRYPPDGSFNYEDHFPASKHPAVPLQQAAPPAFAGAITAPFPVAARLAETVEKLPADAAVVVLVPPTFYTFVPSPGSRDAAEQEACNAVLRSIVAGRPHSNFIDYRIDNALTRNPLNFVDLIHYRAPIAQKIQEGIAASLRFGSAAKIDF
jgi:hypothetical protein